MFLISVIERMKIKKTPIARENRQAVSVRNTVNSKSNKRSVFAEK